MDIRRQIVKTFFKIGVLLTTAVALSFGANSENTGIVNSSMLVNAGVLRTVPIPPPDPDSPRAPLGVASLRTVPIPPPDPDSPRAPLGVASLRTVPIPPPDPDSPRAPLG
jgi:hypothetical protein